MIKKSFRFEIFSYYIVVFIFFTVAVLTYQYEREKKYRTAQLESTLDNITEITYRFIEQNQLIEKDEIERINEIRSVIPQANIRITLISKSGNVVFDSFVDDYRQMENHLGRPEIQKSLTANKGSNIRKSETTKQEYYYYAKNYPEFFIRTAVVYNLEIKNFLKTNWTYLFFIAGIFTIIGLILYLVTIKLSVVITKLKDFAIKAGKNEPIEIENSFPENELGIISSQIIQIYNNLKKAKDDLSNEKEKLFSHLNVLNEGIAFFSPQKKETLSNSHFVQYVNVISQKPIVELNEIFQLAQFKKLKTYISKNQNTDFFTKNGNMPHLEYIVSKNERYFKIQSIIFLDMSFEVMIMDITRLEKRRLVKQQLTSNIAHELKTPLASIKGYLETILDNWPVPEEKHKYFLEKAFLQAERLTDLINDISLLNNIEDAGELFKFEIIELNKVIADVHENFLNRMEEKHITFITKLKPQPFIFGNESLMFSIFQNLVENSINYGGEGIKIEIKCYHSDEKYYYLLYSDNGVGIPQQHHARIFERFYRVDHGRTREKGGTGLGLAIVKNAVQLHGGNIELKNRPKGGTVFLITFPRKNQ